MRACMRIFGCTSVVLVNHNFSQPNIFQQTKTITKNQVDFVTTTKTVTKEDITKNSIKFTKTKSKTKTN